MSHMATPIDRAQNALDCAESVLVITGAGISAESGVPTFRGASGLWKNFDPAKVATPEAFERDPAFVWSWYDARRAQLKDKRPNPGHVALARLEERVPHFFLLTQNVDDLHEQAGSKNLAHIHGSIWQVRCTREGDVSDHRIAPLPEIPPRCQSCGALLRPNVVWFGEIINENAVDAIERFIAEQGEIDVILIVGTEAHFGYIAYWAQRARGKSGILIEINLEETDFSAAADIHLRGPSGEILPIITRS